MALAGIRNAKALAWNSGSLEGEAQSKVGCGGGQGHTDRGDGDRGAQRGRGRKDHTKGQRHRDRAGAEQREVLEAPGRTL